MLIERHRYSQKHRQQAAKFHYSRAHFRTPPPPGPVPPTPADEVEVLYTYNLVSEPSIYCD